MELHMWTVQALVDCPKVVARVDGGEEVKEKERQAQAHRVRCFHRQSLRTIGMGLIDVVWLEWGWGPDP